LVRQLVILLLFTIQSLDRDQIKAIVKCTDGDEKFVGQHRNAKEELASIQSLERDQIKAIVKCTDGDEKFVGQHHNAKGWMD
jgi:hypothetical protein